MEHTLSHGMCRCCASEGLFKNFNSTYQWMGADEVYADMLKECFDVTLTTAEDWNNGGICEVCITQLRNASNFKKQVLQTENQFKKALQENLLRTSIVKEEVNKEDIDLDSDHNVSEDYSGTEFEVPIKEELGESKAKKRAAKASTSRAKKTKTEDGEPSTKRMQHQKKSRRKNKTEPKSDKENSKKPSDIEEAEIQIRLKNIDMTMPRREVDKHLNNIREILINTNATPIRCHGCKGYACSFCVEQYHDPADLKRHTREKHDDAEKLDFMKGKEMHGYFVKLDITALECQLCNERIDTLENVMEHLQEIHKKCMFLDIKNHILPFKFDSESLSCCICCNVFNSFKALLEHVNVHYRNFVCKVCNAGFVNKNILLRHGDAHKTGTFACTDCSKVFDTARKKKLHVRAKHARDLPHKCGYCTERFKEIWAKKNHMMKVHDIKSPGVICKACDKHFATKQGWRLHTARVHLMQKHYKCNECEMEFHTKKELLIHVVKHTGAREFRCDLCFKAYGRHKTLKEHIRRIHPKNRLSH